ncbi:hypothetical protein V6N13_135344 [Hibiscus sabdariffa]|uniref:Uncharacterized protein n=1 Tax=Hibiscus sabdariffa TaxID=183260 RepID=A0ABR2R6J6_9ROSI
MVCRTRRELTVFLMFFGLLAVQPDNVSGLISIDFALKHGEGGNGIVVTRKAVEMKGVSTEQKPVAANNTTGPNESSKRRVRRGWDPIHNRS